MEPRVNHFTIQVGTVNGSGSQSANLVLLRAILDMGVLANGKNLFPSNIAGLPTWFTIRVDERGYACRRRRVDVCVAMNAGTIHDDVRDLAPGSVVVKHDAIPFDLRRDDLVVYDCPFGKLAGNVTADARLKKLLTNMVYVGTLQELLGIEASAVEHAVEKQFARKPKAVALNLEAVRQGAAWAREHVEKVDPYRVERRDQVGDRVLIDGNTAAALGAIFAGCTVVAWYPITPSSSLPEAFIDFAARYRHDANGKAKYAVLQAEDELASLGMVLGASWAGARAMTSTSGPGISLMSEFAGLGYYSETPAVVFDIQRVGPSTGLPTRTAQGDLLQVACLSHGDTQHIVLFPASVAECFTMAQEAFDLSDRFQTPVFVLSDLDLGMNYWLSEPFDYPEKPFDRGKVLTAEDLERIGKFQRYADVDGDAVPYRTLPGNPHPLAPWFCRGSGHNDAAQYTENSAQYRRLLDRLVKKFETARVHVPAPAVDASGDGDIGLVAIGSTHWAIEEARDRLDGMGISTSYMRIRAMPFSREVERFLASHRRIYVVEQNQSAQLRKLLSLELPAQAAKLQSVLHYDGMPIDADTVVDCIVASEEKGVSGP